MESLALTAVVLPEPLLRSLTSTDGVSPVCEEEAADAYMAHRRPRALEAVRLSQDVAEADKRYSYHHRKAQC